MIISCWMDLVGVAFLRTKTRHKWCHFDHSRSRQQRQHKCTETQTGFQKQSTTQGSFSTMTSSSCCKISPVIPIFVSYLLVFSSSICLVHSSDTGKNLHATNQTTLRPEEELHKLKLIRAHLDKINKPAVKTIQSPDGDIIDCIETHLQPAFDHPKLKGQRPLDPPARPNGHNPSGMITEEFQLWSFSGESCPEGTIPIRRTTEQDVLRATSVRKFGRKKIRRVRRDTNSNGHEHAVGYVTGDQYYGAKASINVWAPRVVNQYEFSLSQMWVISGSFGDDLNTIEAGWQVSPELYGDNYPRFFTYWTTDAYQATGCYNLLCSGFVQTNNRIAIGAAISPTSSYSGGQFDISLLIWKLMALVTNRDKIRVPDPEFDLSAYVNTNVTDQSEPSDLNAFLEPGKFLWEKLHAANDGAGGTSPIHKA